MAGFTAHSSRRGGRAGRLLVNLLLLLASVLFTFVALELALRLMASRKPARPPAPVAAAPDSTARDITPEYVPSDRLGWTLRPSSVQRFRRQGFDTTVRSNDLGLRGPEVTTKAVGVERWAVLGDSYGFGWGVEEEETYAAELERLLNADPDREGRYEVVNAALPGFGTYQRLAALERLQPYGLDGIIVEFSASNDVVDDWRAAPYVPDRLGEYQARGTQFTAIERFLNAHSRLFTLLWNRAMPLRLWLEARSGRNLKRSEQLWETILARADELGLEVVVVVNASRYQVLGDGGGVMSWMAHTGFGLRPNTMIRRVIERHRLPWVDGEAVFRAAPASDLFLGGDVHWTPAGHRLVAEALASRIPAPRPSSAPASAHGSRLEATGTATIRRFSFMLPPTARQKPAASSFVVSTNTRQRSIPSSSRAARHRLTSAVAIPRRP